jgi:hypothetical protein
MTCVHAQYRSMREGETSKRRPKIFRPQFLYLVTTKCPRPAAVCAATALRSACTDGVAPVIVTHSFCKALHDLSSSFLRYHAFAASTGDSPPARTVIVKRTMATIGLYFEPRKLFVENIFHASAPMHCGGPKS